MEITLDNINDEFEKILDSSGKEIAIKWYRQRVIEIIGNPDTDSNTKELASAVLVIFNEFYSDSTN